MRKEWSWESWLGVGSECECCFSVYIYIYALFLCGGVQVVEGILRCGDGYMLEEACSMTIELARIV